MTEIIIFSKLECFYYNDFIWKKNTNKRNVKANKKNIPVSLHDKKEINLIQMIHCVHYFDFNNNEFLKQTQINYSKHN